MERFGLPSLAGMVSGDRNNLLKGPGTVYTEFADSFAHRRGLKKTLIKKGAKEEEDVYADLPDVFRHAFMIGLKTLEEYRVRQIAHDSRRRRFQNKMHFYPGKVVTAFEEAKQRAFDHAKDKALDWGFRNEHMQPNEKEFHLMDLWNNNVGVQTAREYLSLHEDEARSMTNEGFADFVAGKLKDRPEIFVVEPNNDPRTSGDSPRFNRSYLPEDKWSVWSAIGKARVPDKTPFRQNMRDLFPSHYNKRTDPN